MPGDEQVVFHSKFRKSLTCEFATQDVKVQSSRAIELYSNYFHSRDFDSDMHKFMDEYRYNLDGIGNYRTYKNFIGAIR